MSDIKYNRIDEDLQQKIISNRESHWINPYAFKDEMAVRRNNDIDKANLWRPVFVRDVEKIMHLPYYNRYADKTQVFSFKNNDDITRRAQHVQLVSRIARNIGSVLGLNLDLIEAIALGHDIGHTPFGHAGERFLSELYHNETNRYFNHNVHSARVLDTIFARNFTMQTLDGVLCHNGEFEQQARRHMLGRGCLFCAGKRESQELFISKVKEIHGDKYDFSKSIYIGAFKKLTVMSLKLKLSFVENLLKQLNASL